MGVTMLSDKDFEQPSHMTCLLCGVEFVGEHQCVYTGKGFSTAGFSDYTYNAGIIKELKNIEILLEKIFEELRMKR